MSEKIINFNEIECAYFWISDHRKSNSITVHLKDGGSYRTEKNPENYNKIKKEGLKFYTCDDDYSDGDDFRYGYYWAKTNDGRMTIDHEPLDFMEGDGHCHLFVKENGKYISV